MTIDPNIVATLTALGVFLAVIGSGVKWLWDKIEARFEKIEAQLAECEARENRSDKRRVKMWRIIDILMDALEDVEPKNRMLNRARELLGSLKEDEEHELERHSDVPV